jgi:D-beta-D-heptose 7-phosphate kinase / D-beta-D-heptose 1-phosphate adenosyltransferase
MTSRKEIFERVRKDRDGYIVVFTNGCFDLLHRGHLSLLKKCRDIAGSMGVVVVGVNSDESVRRLKGDSRPIQDQATRAAIVSSLIFVDYTIVFDEDTPHELIHEVRPNFVVKGGDYRPEDVVGSDVAHVIIHPLEEGYSTSELIRRIRNV